MKLLALVFVLVLVAFNAHAMGSSASTICVAGSGCGVHKCMSEEEAQNSVSTCEWSESYACYPEHGKCEVQENGNCGWTPTKELAACLKAKTAMKFQ